MGEMKVYRFEIYDISCDEMRKSHRWGTLEAIEETAKGRPILDTEAEIDESQFDPRMPGFTSRDFYPAQREGFQTKVKRNSWE